MQDKNFENPAEMLEAEMKAEAEAKLQEEEKIRHKKEAILNQTE